MMRLTPSEQLARAFATLDLPPDSSAGDAHRQYRRLAKRWHPDRHAGDPAAEAEASQRMRQINMAFALVRPALRRKAAGPIPRQTPRSSPTTASAKPIFGERLRQESVDAIVDAIAGPTMFETFFQLASRGALIAGGLTLLPLGSRYRRPLDAVVGGAMLAMALSIMVKDVLRGRT
jgi:DnaJ-class molecular chaperone